MKINIVITLILSLFGCNSPAAKTEAKAPGIIFYVGTYTGPNSEGIYKYMLNKNGSMELIGLAASAPNPSFLAKSADGKFLLAISEVSSEDKTGDVRSYRIEQDSLIFVSKSTSGGAHPCFVAVDNNGFVLVANYTGGNMALLHMDKLGNLSDLLDLQEHPGSGTTARQKGPHAHSAWFDPKNDNIISVDLGTNELWISRIDKDQKKLIPADPPTLMMTPGAGPRHLCFHPNNEWIYVVNELDCTVSLIKRTDEDGYRLVSSVPTLPSDYSGRNTCADIHVSSDGNFVYASNRGHNSIAIFSVNRESGELTAIGFESTHGETPRNFSLSPDEKFLLVANQNSSNIVSFNRDKHSGLLTFNSEIKAPSPVCIRF